LCCALRGHDDHRRRLASSGMVSPHPAAPQQGTCPRRSPARKSCVVAQHERETGPSEAAHVATLPRETAVGVVRIDRSAPLRRERPGAERSGAAAGAVAPSPWRGGHSDEKAASCWPSALAVAPWSWRYSSCGFTRLLRAGSLAHPGGPSLSLRQRRRRFQPPESLFTPLDAGSAVLMLSLQPGPAAGGVCAARHLRKAGFGPLGRRGVPAGPCLTEITAACRREVTMAIVRPRPLGAHH
jgi:hypothetical protein